MPGWIEPKTPWEATPLWRPRPGRERVIDRQVDKYAAASTMQPGRTEQSLQNPVLGGLVERGAGALDDPDGRGSDPPRRIDDRVQDHAALNARLPQELGVDRGRGRKQFRALLHERFRIHLTPADHDTVGAPSLDATTGIILGIEPLLQVHRWNVSRNLRRHGDGLKPFERVGELHRRRIKGLLLLLGCEEDDRCVHADAGVARSGVEGCVHHASDHRGMDYERRQTDAEPSLAAGLYPELEERENHGSTSGA